jgi:DNA-binding CsgD family transcriptional regulator
VKEIQSDPQSIIFTYVSPKINRRIVDSICNRLPIKLNELDAVEELFPLLSNPQFHTDWVVISIDMFYDKSNQLDIMNIFDLIHTLATLIKSTVHRTSSDSKPQRRETKIMLLVEETTDPVTIREIISCPGVSAVSLILKKESDIPWHYDYVKRIVNGECFHFPAVLDLLKTKKKKSVSYDEINLTSRQSQILKLIQERGYSNKYIAKMLGLAECTVKLHMGALFKKYGVKNRTQLVVFANDSSVQTKDKSANH